MKGKIKGQFKETAILILIGVVAFVVLSHLDVVGEKIWWVVSLFMPLIVGGVMAFILNVPMHFFEKQFEKLDDRKPSKFLKRAGAPFSLIITLILFVCALYFIGSVIFPMPVDSIKTLALGVAENYPRWLAFLEAHNIDTSFISEKLASIDFGAAIPADQRKHRRYFEHGQRSGGKLVGILSNIAFGLIFAIYILLNKKKLGEQAKKITYAYLKKSWADEVCDIASLSYRTFAGFISGQCLEAVILELCSASPC